jgi:RNA-directed DNA polymerase
VLTPFDQAIEEAGLWMVRYGDDLCIPLNSCHECMLAEVRVRTGLERLGLRVSESKVKIAHLREGVDFLGFRLG